VIGSIERARGLIPVIFAATVHAVKLNLQISTLLSIVRHANLAFQTLRKDGE
jgi:hypothetical protein